MNGAGYDAFMGQLLSASGTSPDVLTVASLAHATGGDPNPHFWYDLDDGRGGRARDHRDLRSARARGPRGVPRAPRGVPLPRSHPIRAVVASSARRTADEPVAYTERRPGLPAGRGRARRADADRVRPRHRARSRCRVVARHARDGPAAPPPPRDPRPLYNAQTVTPVTADARARALAARYPGRRGLRDPPGRRPHLPAMAARPGPRAAGRARRDEHAALALHDATVRFGDRTLFEGLSLEVAPGEFVAVLGPNGAGKSTLLQVVLGLQSLLRRAPSRSRAPPQRAAGTIGYVPQLHAIDRDLPLRGRDLVRSASTATASGSSLPTRGRARQGRCRHRRRRCHRHSPSAPWALSAAAASSSASASPRRCSPSRRSCSATSRSWASTFTTSAASPRCSTRAAARTTPPCVFVTHEINPVLPFVDRVLYLAAGRFADRAARRDPHRSDACRRCSAPPSRSCTVNGSVLIVGGETEVDDDAGPPPPRPRPRRRGQRREVTS